MQILTYLKRKLRSSPAAMQLLQRHQSRTRRIYKDNYSFLIGKKGVEIGGPSDIFKATGPFPIYGVLSSLDNINFCEENFWSNLKEGQSFVYEQDKPAGTQFIADATDLSKIADCSYDVMLSSHVIEHVANPIKALYEWKRILATNGILIIVAPDMRRTYDRKRPLTKLQHILEDYRNQTQEDDSTHFSEVLRLHDLSRDGTASSYLEHETRTALNTTNRIMHHHTFDMKLLVNLLKEVGFSVTDTQTFRPFHLLAIARK